MTATTHTDSYRVTFRWDGGEDEHTDLTLRVPVSRVSLDDVRDGDENALHALAALARRVDDLDEDWIGLGVTLPNGTRVKLPYNA